MNGRALHSLGRYTVGATGTGGRESAVGDMTSIRSEYQRFLQYLDAREVADDARRLASVVYDHLDTLAEGGRGLVIVGELANCWGWTGDVNGRTVTAIFTG